MESNKTKHTAHCTLLSALSHTFIAFLFIFHSSLLFSSLLLSLGLGFLFLSASASAVPFFLPPHIDLHINFPKSSGQCEKMLHFFSALFGHFHICIACVFVVQCMLFFLLLFWVWNWYWLWG